MNVNSYGQYCPLAMSVQFLCNRWTLLIFREMLFGSSNFNDISRGVPRMSRTLLSSRLKELVNIGLITRHEKRSNGHVEYNLTESGKALETVVFAIAGWGQEWLETEPSLENLDVDFLMWDIRRNVKQHPDLPDPFIVYFFLTDMQDNHNEYWLVFENNETDLCHINRDFNVDVSIEVSAKKLTKVWMGWDNFEQAVTDKEMQLTGPKQYVHLAQHWLGSSSLAHIKKKEAKYLVREKV